MGKVFFSVASGQESVEEASTVGELLARKGLAQGYTALVNGEPADRETSLERDGLTVTVSKAVKGGI